MHPSFGGLPSLFLFWGLALALWLTGGALLAHRQGYTLRFSLGGTLAIAGVFLLGTKLHAWLASPIPVWRDGLAAILLRGFHLPGGVILVALTAPILFRLLRVPYLHFLDAIVPMTGISFAVVRVGCFLNGCCFGLASNLPWAIGFPPGSRAYAVLAEVHQLAPDASRTMPVHPLQLYFALTNLAMAWVLFRMARHKRFDGQLALAFAVMWSWSKAALENLRDPALLPAAPHLMETTVLVAVPATVALVLMSMSRSRSPAARVSSWPRT